MRAFDQIDVFTDTPLLGNPVAVVHDALGLTDEEMQRVARWTNLSETTFLLPPTDVGIQGGADYRVRIFAPGGELPFAGHPTIGTAKAWLRADGSPHHRSRLIQECEIGLVDLRVDAATGIISFAAPPLVKDAPLDDTTLTRVAAGLGVAPDHLIDARWIVNGPKWIGVLMADANALLALEPRFDLMGELMVGVIAPLTNADPAQYEVRAFAPAFGVNEDPVTGSLAGAFGQWLIPGGRIPERTVFRQGTKLHRRGMIHVTADDDRMWVGGQATSVISGEIAL